MLIKSLHSELEISDFPSINGISASVLNNFVLLRKVAHPIKPIIEATAASKIDPTTPEKDDQNILNEVRLKMQIG
jgi:hypothetical protein